MEPFSSNLDFFSSFLPPKAGLQTSNKVFPPFSFFFGFVWFFFLFSLHLFSQQDANPSAVEEIKHHKEKPN